ncbi:hypothetical protein ACFL3Q_13715 [Planctomycetota bacterium]
MIFPLGSLTLIFLTHCLRAISFSCGKPSRSTNSRPTAGRLEAHPNNLSNEPSKGQENSPTADGGTRFFNNPNPACITWTNLSLRFATEFATVAHVWRSVGARLHLGQLHKSFIDKHKPFIHNSLQTAHSDQISDAPSPWKFAFTSV